MLSPGTLLLMRHVMLFLICKSQLDRHLWCVNTKKYMLKKERKKESCNLFDLSCMKFFFLHQYILHTRTYTHVYLHAYIQSITIYFFNFNHANNNLKSNICVYVWVVCVNVCICGVRVHLYMCLFICLFVWLFPFLLWYFSVKF